MNIGILGTGMVGDAIGTKLIQLGHTVKMGSRAAKNEKAEAWVKKNGAHASAGTFAEAAQFGEVLFNCTAGVGSLDALRAAGSKNLSEKILIDISNPLDFSKGMPPSLTVSNTDSLGEQIQRSFPDVKVVKTLNTLANPLMVNPSLINNGDHTIFMSGNDADAKAKVLSLLVSFGWKSENVIDLGDITTARGTEQILPLWVRLFGKFQTPMFQLKVVK